MHRSAQDDIFTDDDRESAIGGPTTIIEADFDVETQDYSMSTASKVYASPSDGGESPIEALLRASAAYASLLV
jgi:hypothetical protein